MYTADYWDNEFILESAQPQGGAQFRGIDEHTKDILDTVPLYETFVRSHDFLSRGQGLGVFLSVLTCPPTIACSQLSNLWDLRDNVIPMRMETIEAMRTLSEQVRSPT